MNLFSRLSIPRLSFLQQLAITFAIGIFCLTLVSSVAISNLSSQIVRDKLIEQGRQATETFAGQATLALLYASADNAQEPAKAILGFPSVEGVAIYDTSHQLLFAQGEDAEGKPHVPQWPDALRLEHETPKAWYFVAPVYSHRDVREEDPPFASDAKSAQLLGFVRLAMGKDTLWAMENSILRTNLVVAIAFASLFLLILLGVTKRLTTPLQHLANTMDRASAGEKRVRANVKGPKDIMNMEMAFNTMMEVLESRELELVKARDAALESARIKGEFAANVSHELRTPLNAVLGMLELLQDMSLNPKQLEYVLIAHNAGTSLLKLIEDILDFSRIEAGMTKLQPSDFVLHEILDEVVGLLAGQAQRRGLELGYVIADDIPMVLRGEASRLRQVLVNLVGNGVKFSEHGGVEIRVAHEPTAKDPWQLRFEVIDSGIGIPREAQKRIFDAFVQVDGSTTRIYGGTGLGLAICRQLVEFMGGEIGVDSEPGQGASFWFTIPFSQPTGNAYSSRNERPAIAGLRFLVVADSERSRRFLGQILHGWEAGHAKMETTRAALEQMRHAADRGEPYHFAIVDQAAASNRAVELVRAMAEDPATATTKVILLSHQGPLGQGTAAESVANLPNVVGHIPKPVQASLLYDCIVSIESDAQPRAPLPPRRDQTVYLGSRILVVEDNRANQQVATAMLERIGCHVELAATGREALALVVRQPFDLILMDCHMPEMDGYEATRRIRGLEGKIAHVPIIAMTANVQKGDNERCLAAGMDDYLSKPLKLSAVREKLQHWLSQAGRPRPAPAECSGATAAPAPLLQQQERLLDMAILDELREDIGDAFPKMIEVFLEDTPTLFHKMEQGISAGDATAVADFAHCIKGAAKNLGANRLAEATRQLEEQGRSGRMQNLDELYTTAFIEYELLKAALQQEIHSDQERLNDQESAKPCVLVADDDRTLRFALCDILQRDGYRVEQASSGRQAISICERRMPDLLLLDAKMPEMDGFTVCSRLRSLPNGVSTPVLIITALEDEHTIDKAFAAGATDYIPKPVHFAVLRQRVARLLDASRTEEHASRLAYQDTLTGLPNRALFMERLEAALSNTRQEPHLHAVLVLDLDRFKLTNDALGHEAGDLLLKTAAMRIQGCARAGDLVSRFGGDEFTILLENIHSTHNAATVAEKICAAIAKPFVISSQEYYISASIGISLAPTDGSNASLLVKRADTAMFRAKERGNGYRFYEDNMEEAISTKHKLENDLWRALERNEFFLQYQPQYNQKTGRVIGMEALIRWRHPELGLISPGRFIPVAEESGLVSNIGAWVLREACRQNQTWQQAGLPALPVAVNLSARQFEEDDIAGKILSILQETGLESRYLELELTESAVMKEPQKTRLILESLKAAGMLISVDDFGTGYSSLGQLKNFPFDKLKIDQSFIRDITTNPDDAEIVLAIISIARSMNLKVIAEGVETLEQLQYLRDNGCEEIQGYYFSRPVDAADIPRLLAENMG
jgi:diguanylate cyclase (GGDEF)-like protein